MSAVASSAGAEGAVLADMLAGFDRAKAGRDSDGRVPATVLTGYTS